VEERFSKMEVFGDIDVWDDKPVRPPVSLSANG